MRFAGFFAILLTFTAVFAAAQESPANASVNEQFSRRFETGTRLYEEARMAEAAAFFRQAQEIADNNGDWARALYWVILAQLALADYGSALKDMDELQKAAPDSVYSRDMAYHRGRAYFNHGYYEDALVLFKRFNDSVSADDAEAADKKAAAFFWMGECLYLMGQFDDAERFFAWVVSRYPQSPKAEVSSYRIDLIKQKKIEAELLALLRWSHEESLRTGEDYQRRIMLYEGTLNIYQKRLAELQGAASNPETQAPTVQEQPAEITNDDLIKRAMQLETEVQRRIRELALNQPEINGGQR